MLAPVVSAILAAGTAASLPQGGEHEAPVGLTVVIVNVGQGDGAVIRAPNGQIHVIDGGPDGQGAASVQPVIGALQPAGYGFTFLSHFHDDHQGGLDELLAAFPFQLAYDRGDVRRTNTSPATNDYLAAAGARRRTIGLGVAYQLGGGATVRCIAVNGSVAGGGGLDPTGTGQEENSRSIALRLENGPFSMWFGGDLTGGGNSTADVESAASLSCGDVDVYKLNHHGSNTSTNLNLVSRLDPEVAIASAGLGNSYGHPTGTVVNRLNQAAATRALLATTSGAASIIGFSALGHVRIDAGGVRYRVTAQNGDFLDFYVDEVAGSALAPGDVRVAEVHRNPARVPDTNGEYVEVVGTGPRPLALKGLRLAANGGTVTLAANYALVPGRSLLFQVDGVAGRNGGLPFGHALPWQALALGDTADTVALQRGAVTVDAWGFAAGSPGGSGVAAERRDLLAAAGNANAAAATAQYGGPGGDLGTPGQPNGADTTPWPVLVDAAVAPGELVLRGAAVGFAGRPVWSALGLAYGSSPGFPFLGAVIPLNFDPMLQTFLSFPGAIAAMPAGGYRSLRVPLPQPNPLPGLTLRAAHVVLDLGTLAVPGLSPAIPVVLP